MEEMIARRAPLFANSNPDMTIEQATALLQEVFPHLTRWKQEKENWFPTSLYDSFITSYYINLIDKHK